MTVTAEEIRRRAGDGLNRAARVGAVDVVARTVQVAFASEAPVARWFGDEVLVISTEAMRTDRLDGGAAVLLNHDWDAQIGVVESVSIDAGRARAVLRFGNGAAAREVFDDIADGIRRHVSVGYEVHQIEVEKRHGQPDLVRLIDWAPFEISIVAVPADPSVGVGRAAAMKGKNMAERTQPREAQGNSDDGSNGGEARERSRVQSLLDMGEQYRVQDLASEAIRNGATVEQLQSRIFARMNENGTRPLGDLHMIGLTEREADNFSIMNLVRHLVAPTEESARAAGFELEASRAFAQRTGREPQGAFVPPDVLLHRNFNRAMNTGTAGQGAELVATQLLEGNFIDGLRNRLSIMQAGAIMLGGLIGNVAIPRLSGGASHEWLAEGGSVTDSRPSTDVVTMSPKTVATSIPITRRLMLQSTPAVETMVRNDLTARIAIAIDGAALNGDPSPNAPTGLRQLIAASAIDWTTDGQPTFPEIVALETAVATANADTGSLAYIYGAAMAGHLKTTPLQTGAPIFVEQGETVNGYRRYKSNQAQAGDVFFGNWSDVLLGMWSGLDIRADVWTLAASDGLVIRAFQDVDVAIRHPESFALGQTAPD
ncbi:MAG: phage major capsid protein [Hyphomonas sp.]